jgi:hypothetical protein
MCPACNWGLATGTASGLVVIDVDGAAGRASVAALERQGLTLPATLTVTTGRTDGGEHRYYRPLAGVDIRNDQSGKIGAHIDVRGSRRLRSVPAVRSCQRETLSLHRPIRAGCGLARLGNRAAHSAPANALARRHTQARRPWRHGSRTNTLVSLGRHHAQTARNESWRQSKRRLLAENAAKCDSALARRESARHRARTFREALSGW